MTAGVPPDDARIERLVRLAGQPLVEHGVWAYDNLVRELHEAVAGARRRERIDELVHLARGDVSTLEAAAAAAGGLPGGERGWAEHLLREAALRARLMAAGDDVAGE